MLKIGSVVWGVKDIRRAAAFWCAALHYRPKYPLSDDWAVLVPENGEGLQLSLSLVTSPHARRHHMDLFADDREAEVERLISLGAQRKEWRYEPDADYTVLTDTEGNPFCVVSKGPEDVYIQ